MSAPVLAGVTPTAGGLVSGGDMKGHVVALDAKTGDVRWTYDLEFHGNTVRSGTR